MSNRCLYCYMPLGATEIDFHPACCKKIFGKLNAPMLPYTEKDTEDLAKQVIQNRITITGVQPKLSLNIAKSFKRDEPQRLTVVGLWGNYILKLPTAYYPSLPEVEDLTMHLAEIAKISTVPHSLIRMESGQLAYITKRIDRKKGQKIHMEDMCQLTERLTEHKYQGSYEQIAKAISKYSTRPGLDLINYWEQVLFCFLTGNADMHLKNFSLLDFPELGYGLAPAYDLVATALINPADTEELALTLNGKKHRIKKDDFVTAFDKSKLNAKQQTSIFKKMEGAYPLWLAFISISFLNTDLKNEYKQTIGRKFIQLGLSSLA